jgi:hypothetical protein
MPTANPRINVTLSPALDALVGQLAKHERISKAMVLRELLEAAEPSLKHAVALMEAAQGATAAARKRVVEGMDEAIAKAENVSAEMLGFLSEKTNDLFEVEETIKGRRPAAAQAQRAPSAPSPASRPPISNRGVKSPKPRHKPGGQP